MLRAIIRGIIYMGLALAFSAQCSSAIAQVANITDVTQVPKPGTPHNYLKDMNEIVNPANGSVSNHRSISGAGELCFIGELPACAAGGTGEPRRCFARRVGHTSPELDMTGGVYRTNFVVLNCRRCTFPVATRPNLR